METEQLKNVLLNLKAKVGELNLDAAVEALNAVYSAKEDLKAVQSQVVATKATLEKLVTETAHVTQCHVEAKKKMDAIKAEAAKKLAEFK